MSRIQMLLDVDQNPVRLDTHGNTPVKLPEAISGPSIIITDYQASPFGVESLQAQADDLAPLLEKRLRDQGDIDELAQVLIHSKEQHDNLAMACYTAVPVSTHLRYRGWGAQHDDHVLLFPLPEAILALCKQQALSEGLLVFVHGQSTDLFLLQDNRIIAANRLHMFSDDSREHQRIAQQICDAALKLNPSLSDTTCVLVEATIGECAPLQQELLALGLVPKIPVLPATQLFKALKPSQADLSNASRMMYVAHQALPVVGTLMFLLCLISAGLAWYWSTQTAEIQQSLSNHAPSATEPSSTASLEVALDEANSLVQSQAALKDFLDISARARKTPDPALLMQNLRQAASDGIELTEVNILSDEQDVLIVVVGRSGGIAAPLSAETRFVNALNKRGYTVVKREIESESGKSLFRLALIWSAT